MGITSSVLEPEDLINFKKLSDVSLSDINIPETTENRKRTDVKWLVILGIFVAVFFALFSYTLYNGDIRRLTQGYDNCGDICGEKNYKWPHVSCSGKDLTNYSISLDGPCVKTGENNPAPWSSFLSTLSSVKLQIIFCCFSSISITTIVIFLFHYCTRFMVWFILISSYVAYLILVILIWFPTERSASGRQLKTALVLTFFAIVFGLILCYCRNQIRGIILLFKEATDAMFRMPWLIAVSLTCQLCIILLTIVFVITIVLAMDAGPLIRTFDDRYIYHSKINYWVYIHTAVVYLWLLHFLTGINYMVIAGAVSKWYFTRDRNCLRKPITSSLHNTFIFHLGCVALGSMLITLTDLIKMLISALMKKSRAKVHVDSCTSDIRRLFIFLSKNAYIITAIHGQPFIRSGKRAARILFQNADDVIAINFIGNFVLFIAKCLIVISTGLVSYFIFSITTGSTSYSYLDWVYMPITFFSMLVAHMSIGVMEITVDTLFICYCEDKLLNEGINRPFYMSRNLMEFIENTKREQARANNGDANILLN